MRIWWVSNEYTMKGERKSSDDDKTHKERSGILSARTSGFLRAKRMPDIMVETTAYSRTGATGRGYRR